MIGWILLIILAALVLLSFVLRLGVLAGYGQVGPFVKIRIGPGYITVFPRKIDPEKSARKKEKKAQKKEKKQAKKAAKAEKKPLKTKKQLDKGGLLSMVWDLLPVVKNATDSFGKKLQIDRLAMDLTWAGDDPADAAIRYGQAWAAAETLLAFLENCVVIKERQVTIRLDFYEEKPRIYLEAGMSLTLAQLTAIGLPAAVQGVKVFLRHRKHLFKKPDPAPAGVPDTVKGELNHGKEPSHQ